MSPARALTICAAPGCRQIVQRGRCEQHRRHGWAEWQAARGNRHSRGYGAPWVSLRRQVLAEEPVCRLCGLAASADVDHIIPKADGGTDDRANLRGVCHDCHKRRGRACA